MNFKKKVTEEDFMKIIDGLEKQLEHTRTRDNEDVFDEIKNIKLEITSICEYLNIQITGPKTYKVIKKK
jgi:hypothetical protein